MSLEPDKANSASLVKGAQKYFVKNRLFLKTILTIELHVWPYSYHYYIINLDERQRLIDDFDYFIHLTIGCASW